MEMSPNTATVILLVLVVCFCPFAEMALPLCSKQFTGSYCHHNQSGLCGFKNSHVPVSCSHQLQHRELTSDMATAECQVEKLNEGSGCGSLQPAYVYVHEKPLVGLHLYLYSTWVTNRSVVNFTFPSPDWRNLRFQYKVNMSEETKCREFSLRGVSLPLDETLVYDCAMFNVPGDVARDGEITVKNDRGEGRTFIFRIPSHTRIHPKATSLAEWHVFFYLHQDFIATSSHLPVTVQSAGPFPGVSYRVSIVMCLDVIKSDCVSYNTLNSTLVDSPKEDEWTVHLPIWSNPGSYAVTVQIESLKCPPHTGCHVSVSPTFEIEAGLLGIWMSVAMGFFLIAFLTFLLMFNKRLRTNKETLHALQEEQPSVLLVYIAENQPYMEFINMFADFLKNTCHLFPYLVDRDVGIEDPNCWTRDHILRADKVLFIIPGNPGGESITPIRNQWIVALNYLSGHHFTTRQVSRKVAAVTLPSSGSTPSEILHVQHFKLVEQIAALVTWLHGGTWLDEMFLWQPVIRSAKEKVSYTWPKMRLTALRASATAVKTSEPHTCLSIVYGNIYLSSAANQTAAERDTFSIHSEDSTITEEDSEDTDSVFDPDIPSFKRLLREEEGSSSKVSVNSEPSENSSVCSFEDIFT